MKSLASNMVPAVLFLFACVHVVVDGYYTSPWYYASTTRPPSYTTQYYNYLNPGGSGGSSESNGGTQGPYGGTQGYGSATAPATSSWPWWLWGTTQATPKTTDKGVLWLISEFFSLTRRLDASRTYNATRRSDLPVS